MNEHEGNCTCTFCRSGHAATARRLAAAFAEARKRARNDVEEAHLDTSWQEIVNDSEAVDALLGDMGIAQEGT